MKYEYIIEALLAVISFFSLIGFLIMTMFCFMRMDFKFAWIATALAFG